MCLLSEPPERVEVAPGRKADLPHRPPLSQPGRTTGYDVIIMNSHRRRS